MSDTTTETTFPPLPAPTWDDAATRKEDVARRAGRLGAHHFRVWSFPETGGRRADMMMFRPETIAANVSSTDSNHLWVKFEASEAGIESLLTVHLSRAQMLELQARIVEALYGSDR